MQYTSLDFDKLPAQSGPRAPRRRVLVILFVTLTLFSTVGLILSSPSARKNLASLHLGSQPRYIMTFTKHPEFFDLSTQGDGNWTALLPPNGGFVVQKSESGKGYEMAGLTMFHQLHCLQMIRTAVQEYMGISSPNGGHHGANGMLGRQKTPNGVRHGPFPDEQHWVHCLDYLMQGILCHADNTIEMAHEDEEGRRVVDGYGVQHMCRNPDAVWAQVMGEKSIPGWRKGPKDAEPELE